MAIRQTCIAISFLFIYNSFQKFRNIFLRYQIRFYELHGLIFYIPNQFL
jgi:hypothetical protein